MFSFVFVATSLLFAVGSSVWYYPEQVHIALGSTPDVVTFNWVTFDYPIKAHSFALLSKNANPTTFAINASGHEYLFTDTDNHKDNRSIHIVTVSDLEPSTKYYYKVGEEWYGYSPVFSFTTDVNAQTLSHHLPRRYVIYGDMGEVNDVTLPAITAEAKHAGMDVVIHVGDFAYDFYSDYGANGDAYMNDIQAIAANVPYMTCPGNHEAHSNFTHYSHRFRGQPSKTGTVWTGSGPTPNNWYFSWNSGLVHFVAISTEIYFDFPYMVEQQFNWLKADLEAANKNRTRAPWLVVYGHKQLYCSTDFGDCTDHGSATLLRYGITNSKGQREYGLEQLFYDSGVDFYFDGHQHSYERCWDVYLNHTTKSTTNMPATTYISTGAAGSDEGLTPFNPTKPVYSAVRLLAYSYTHFDVYNSTHILLQQIVADPALTALLESNVADQVWYIQEHHGPFADVNREYVVINDGVKPGWTRDLYTENGLPYTRAVFEAEQWVPYISNDKRDYANISNVYF